MHRRKLEEDKLAAVLGQVAAIRRRINRLALQRCVFISLAVSIIGAVMVVLAAFHLSPRAFTLASSAAAIACFVLVVITIGWSCIGRVDSEGAARIADRTAALAERLTTVVAHADRADRSRLWMYLVDDTLQRHHAYAPKRIEPRRLSRSIFVLVAALLIGTLASPIVLRARLRTSAPAQSPARNLIESFDAGNNTTEARTSVGTSGAPASGRGALGRIARSTENLQKWLTGGQQLVLQIGDRTMLQRADTSADAARNSSSPPASVPRRSVAVREAPPSNAPGAISIDAPSGLRTPGNNPPPPSDSHSHRYGARAGAGEGSGRGHGWGTDPGGLYGAKELPAHGGSSFQLAINGRPMVTGKEAGAPEPVRKIDADLSPVQHSDEPLARSVVPADDRDAIQAIFER